MVPTHFLNLKANILMMAYTTTVTDFAKQENFAPGKRLTSIAAIGSAAGNGQAGR
jgi:hypothetical protein